MKFNETNIERLAELMKTNNIESLQLEQEGEKLILKTTRKNKTKYIQSQVATEVQAAAPAKAAISKPVAPVAPTNSYAKVTSPMVGTFYTSPSPDSPNYVKEGQIISIGDTLCIVEAMKLMNEIKSTVNGKIVKVCSKSGAGVKSGDELFWIEEN